MDDVARARLEAVGWHAARRVPTREIAGFTLFPAAREFLERFGGLRLRGARGPETYFHTDPSDVATDPSWTDEWEQASGTRVFPIGATAYGDYTLIIDEHGRVFGMDMYIQMTYWADDADELLDVILGNGGTFRPVDPDDRRPVE